MLNNRRKFMLCGGMAAGGALLGRLVSDPQFTEGETAEADVQWLISRYGQVINMSKDSSGVIHVKAKIQSRSRMTDLFTHQHQLPLSTIRATSHNTMDFSHRGKQFSISHHV